MAIELKSEIDRTSYALGMNLGQSLKQIPSELNTDAAIQGLSDMLNDQKPALSQEEYMMTMRAFQQKMQAAEKQAMETESADNVAEQKEFLANNKKEDGVTETESGLQYSVISEGNGKTPGVNDTVRVHYTGTLLDGTVFDSSVQRGQPAEFGVSQVIKGWTEGLQLMKAGSKYKFFIPSELAYGQRGAGQAIGPDAMLIFDVELLDVL